MEELTLFQTTENVYTLLERFSVRFINVYKCGDNFYNVHSDRHAS